MTSLFKQLTVLLVPLALFFAWSGGKTVKKEAMSQSLSNISKDIVNVSKVDEHLYQGYLRNKPEEVLFLADESRPGYGGPLKVAVVVDGKKKIQYVAVLESSDTHSYLEKVVGLGLLDKFTGKSIEEIEGVDGISGATLTSSAIINGVQNATQRIGTAKFNMPVMESKPRELNSETYKLVLICLFFLAAFAITRKKFRYKKKARAVLMIFSVLTLGFWLGAQFSISTIISLISGSWLNGMASYAAILCLVLAVVFFLATKKNLFCMYICPFGAVQEGLGKITGCSAPQVSPWMNWVSRGWVLAVLLAALYFQTPADAMYEPFSKMFNFIGSGVIYTLTILIIVASLIVKRPWCNLFCPAKSMFFYLRFARNSFSPKPKGPMLKMSKDKNFMKKTKLGIK